MKNKLGLLKTVAIVLVVLFGSLNPSTKFDQSLGFVLTIYVTSVVTGFLPKIFQLFNFLPKNYWYVLPIIIIFVLTSWVNGKYVVNRLGVEPVAETYRSDLDDFLRTYYLMEKGTNYYLAFDKAVAENAFREYVAKSIWAFRLPTTFYFWKWLPGNDGISIFIAFLGLSSSLLLSSYLIIYKLTKLVGPAILSSYLLFPYLHFAARDPVLLHTEWWGLLPLFLGIYFLINNNKKLTIICFALSLIIRELYLIPILFILIIAVLRKDLSLRSASFPVLVLLIFLIFHILQVLPIIGSFTGSFNLRVHSFGKEVIQGALAYGAGEYLFYKLKIFIVFMFLGFIAVLPRIQTKAVYLFSFFLFPLSFLIIGSSMYNDYWGVFFIPGVLITVPLLFS